MTRTFQLTPLDTNSAAELRQEGGTAYVADTHPGFPCRQCLRDADVGDELLLVSHDPFSTNSPYRSASPIFIHRHDCGAPITDVMPEQLTRRLLSVRAFNEDEIMIDAAVIDGADLEDTLARFLDNDETDHVHVHNAHRGCWATAVTRDPSCDDPTKTAAVQMQESELCHTVMAH